MFLESIHVSLLVCVVMNSVCMHYDSQFQACEQVGILMMVLLYLGDSDFHRSTQTVIAGKLVVDIYCRFIQERI